MTFRLVGILIALALLAVAAVSTAEAAGKRAKPPASSSGWSTVTLGDAAWD